MRDRIETAEFLRKSATWLREIASNRTPLSRELIEMAEEREAAKLEAAVKPQPAR
jgi:hypothetical protein